MWSPMISEMSETVIKALPSYFFHDSPQFHEFQSGNHAVHHIFLPLMSPCASRMVIVRPSFS